MRVTVIVPAECCRRLVTADSQTPCIDHEVTEFSALLIGLHQKPPLPEGCASQGQLINCQSGVGELPGIQIFQRITAGQVIFHRGQLLQIQFHPRACRVASIILCHRQQPGLAGAVNGLVKMQIVQVDMPWLRGRIRQADGAGH